MPWRGIPQQGTALIVGMDGWHADGPTKCRSLKLSLAKRRKETTIGRPTVDYRILGRIHFKIISKNLGHNEFGLHHKASAIFIPGL